LIDKFKIESFIIIIFLSGLTPSSKDIEFVAFIYLLISVYAFYFFSIKKNILIFRNLKLFFIFIAYICLQNLYLPEWLIKFLSSSSHQIYKGLLDSNFFSIALNPLQGFKYFIVILTCLSIIVITPKLIDQKRKLKKTLEIILWVGALHSIIALGLYFLDNNFFKGLISLVRETNYSFSGLFINRNNFSLYMVLFFIIAVNYYSFYYKYFSKIKKDKLFNFILSDLFIIRAIIILFAITIVLTKSRAGNFSFLMVLGFLFVLDFIKHKKLSFISLTVLSIFIIDILLVGFFVGFEKVIERYAVTTVLTEESRLSFFDFGLIQFFKFWLTGYGLGSFETIFRIEYNNFIKVADHVHNDFIEYAGELGLIGLILLFLIFLKYLSYLKKNYLNDKLLSDIINIILLTLVAVVLHGNLDFALHKPAIIFFVTFNLSLGLCQISRKVKTTSRSHSQIRSQARY